jgi:hypothetical protein
MAKVFLHIHDAHQANWENKIYDFARVPQEGEYVTVSSDSPWYQVELVLHTPFSHQMDAEVFAVRVDESKVMKSKVSTRPAVSF